MQLTQHARTFCVSLAAIAMAVTPLTAMAKISTKPKVFINGQPARNAIVSLYNCKTGALEAGPLSAGQDGSVELDNIDPGDHRIRAEIASGYGNKEVQLVQDAQQPIDLEGITPRLTRSDRMIPIAMSLFTFLMVIYPIGRYLAKPWTFRREYLIGQLAGESMKLYYEQFRAGALVKGKPVGDPGLTPQTIPKPFEPTLANGTAGTITSFQYWAWRA